MEDFSGWVTLRELDTGLGLVKGTAFRAFRRIEHELADGRDYRLLRYDEDYGVIDTLKNQRRIYASSVNAVLLSPALARRLREVLAKHADGAE